MIWGKVVTEDGVDGSRVYTQQSCRLAKQCILELRYVRNFAFDVRAAGLGAKSPVSEEISAGQVLAEIRSTPTPTAPTPPAAPCYRGCQPPFAHAFQRAMAEQPAIQRVLDFWREGCCRTWSLTSCRPEQIEVIATSSTSSRMLE